MESSKVDHYKTYARVRFSMSGQYDVVCMNCGLTDGIYAGRNVHNTVCPYSTGELDEIWEPPNE